MSSFYTNVQVYGSRILYRGVENGRKVKQRLDYNPTLYVPSKVPTGFTTVSGDYVSEIKPGNIRDCRDFVEKYKDVDNFKIYGMQRYEYAFISDNYPGEVEWNLSHITVANIDIEVGSENGFPEPSLANEEITSITMKTNHGKFVVFGCGDFNNTRPDVRYVKCRDEIDLIKRFVDEWTGDYPDIITGWNVERFDIVYLVNRFTKLLGEDFAKRLSPWNIIGKSKTTNNVGQEEMIYKLVGISTLDYITMYRKFAPGGTSQESYRLDHICHVELDERKLSYEDYGNLHNLYKENYQLFIEYNIKDVELVEKLEEKLKLIELTLTLAYDSKTNPDDAFSQVRMWDSIIYNHLKEKNMVIPPNERHSKDEAYIGAYVKDPIIGLHKWPVSFDLNSLYPHLIIQWNISPDVFIPPEKYSDDMRQFLSSTNVNIDNLLSKSIDTSFLKDHRITLSPNGQFFSITQQGFLAEIMEKMYNDRTKFKKKSIEAKKELEKESDPAKKYEIEKTISKYNNLQLGKKVSLNSAYGALGNEYFRFFDVRQAIAITTAGQLAIRWIENRLNDYLNKLLNTKDKDYVIASDTDSIYLCLDQLVSKTIRETNPTVGTKEIVSFLDRVCETKIQSFIDKSYNDLAQYVNAYDQKMQMKREAIADKGIWTAKKRYILNVYNNEGVEYIKPKLKVMGLEMVKSSTPSSCRKKLKEAIEVIINKDENSVIQFIETYRKEFRNEDLSDIAFPRGVNGLDKYGDKTSIYGKGTPIHVRGSLIYNNLIKTHKLSKKYPFIKEGEKVKYIYLKEPNIIRSNVIAFSQVLPIELDLHKYIDYDTQFEKAFVEPLKIILDSIGWKTEKTSSLEAFFS
jgi:DNA polymerase elongation subunit (family B)